MSEPDENGFDSFEYADQASLEPAGWATDYVAPVLHSFECVEQSTCDVCGKSYRARCWMQQMDIGPPLLIDVTMPCPNCTVGRIYVYRGRPDAEEGD